MVKPDLLYCAKYPFTEEAKEYVRELGLTLEDMLKHPVYNECLSGGQRRFLDAVRGGIRPELGDTVSQEIAVLSYPVARLIANLVGGYNMQRYGVSEAETAYEFLRDSEEDMEKLMKDLDLGFDDDTIDCREYLKLSQMLVKKDDRWRLVNRVMDKGKVRVEEGEKRELLTEKIRLKVASPVDVKRAPAEVSKLAGEIKKALAHAQTTTFEGDVSDETTPPCIKYMLALLETGETTHNMMFILGTYLTGRGLSEDKVVEVFSKSPSFDEKKTRYQLKFLTGDRGSTKYSCPTCSKIKSYGLCKGECEIKHPLQYRRGKKQAT